MSRGNPRTKPPAESPSPEALRPWTPPIPRPVEHTPASVVPEGSLLDVYRRFNAIHRRTQPFGRRKFSDVD